MMMHIVMIAVVVTIGGLFLLVTGRRQRDQQRTRLDVNRELYEQRKQELEVERDDGLLSERAFVRANDELDKRFVVENTELEQINDRQVGNQIWFPAIIVMVLGVVAYSLFGSWSLQRQADDALAELPTLGQKVLSDAAAETTREELETFALGLRQKLALAPNDAMAWLVYARTMSALGQIEQAMDAYDKSLSLNPTRSTTLLSYSQLLVRLGEDKYWRKAAGMLSQVLQQDPSNQEALSLLGFIAFERGDWEQAQTAWKLLLAQLSENDERYIAIAGALQEVEQRIAASEAVLTVTVTLADASGTNVPAGGTLFVYLRDPDGTAMPAAVVRQPINDFPVTVTLADAQAMLPDYKMSDLTRWQVMARISTDEQIDAGPGDLDAKPVIMDAREFSTVELVIQN